ncbi:MAG: TolC family protein [Bacteroidetes bacterium]|nr:TolC family protein [Bacteroidota bacterium]
MKNLIITLSFIAVSITATAQTENRLSLSQQDAINIGLKNRYDVQANKYNVELAKNTLVKNKKEWIPDISASGNVRYNTQLQATLIPAGFGGLTEPQLLALGAKDVTIAGLSLNQPIYKPGINTDIKIAANNINLQKEKNIADEIEIKTKISEAYLNVLLKNLQYKIVLADENRYKEYFTMAEAKYKLGALIQNDYLRSKLDYENAQLQTAVAEQNKDIAISQLKYEINLPQETSLVLTDTLGTETEATLTPGNAANRTEIKQLKLVQADNALQLQKVKLNALPAFSFAANYSQQFLSDRFNYGDGKWWTPFSYVALTVNIPLTGNIKNHNSIKEYKLRMQQADLTLQQKTTDINNEIDKAATELNNASRNVTTTKNNYDLSNTIYENQKQQYSIGDFQYVNLLDTERSLSTAEQNYIRAVYNYLLAKLNYQKAIGNL